MDDPETDPDDSGPPNRRKALRSVGLLFGSGMQLAISVALMFFLGRWADEKLQTAPWLLIAGVLFGVGAGLYNFIRTAIGIDDQDRKEDRSAQ
jgi:ATP synthase protein I